MTDKSYLGKGAEFPFRFSDGGGVATADYEKKIKLNLIAILSTDQGTRFMEPRFGSNLKQFLYEPLDMLTIKDMTNSIRQILGVYEPLIEITDIFVDTNDNTFSENFVPLVIKYIIKSTNTEDNLVYPFYRP